jgi:NADPH:quinone reductase-like Zn-dependent oxidoreductase
VKAIVQDSFGPPEVLELREIDQPEPGDDEVLVRVHAASVNPADWYAMTGTPYLARPQMGLRRPRTRLGLDLAGVVEGGLHPGRWPLRPAVRRRREQAWAACRRVLHPRATLVLVGAPKGNRLLGSLDHIGRIRLASLRASQKVVFFISKRHNEDLVALQRLLEAGTVTPVVERAYPLRETAHAFRYLGEGHARGKLVVTV